MRALQQVHSINQAMENTNSFQKKGFQVQIQRWECIHKYM